MPGDDTATLYGEVKAWIAKQEAYEAATKKPAPLTNAQRKALEVLRLPLNPPTPPPEIGDVDYISLLCRYRQAHPEGGDINWGDPEPAPKPVAGAIGWICRVSIDVARDQAETPIESFPAVGYGLDDSQQPPAFPKKKDAKKYAAKCAVDWLIAQSLMPDNLEDVKFPDGYRPSRSASSSSSSSSSTPALKRPTEGSVNVHAPPLKKPTKGPVDVNDETIPATQRVDALCAQMGLRAPTYTCRKIDPQGLDKYYDGHPNFGPDTGGVGASLEGLCRVSRVFGQDKARQQMAELVLIHLLPIYRGRQRVLESLSVPSEAS